MLDPDHDEARALLGWAEYFDGDHPAATITFKTLLRRQPGWEGLYDGLGWSRLRAGRPRLAREAYRAALAIEPEYVDALVGLGSAEFELKRYAEALPPLTTALRRLRPLVGEDPPQASRSAGEGRVESLSSRPPRGGPRRIRDRDPCGRGTSTCSMREWAGATFGSSGSRSARWPSSVPLRSNPATGTHSTDSGSPGDPTGARTPRPRMPHSRGPSRVSGRDTRRAPRRRVSEPARVATPSERVSTTAPRTSVRACSAG